MKKLAIASLLLLASTLAIAGESGKIVYMKEQLVKDGANSIHGIVDKYMADSGRTSLINPGNFILLLDGAPAPDAARQLDKSDRVEVLSNGDSVVVNIVTKPSSGA